jgi:uncharacterized membrane protein YhhN
MKSIIQKWGITFYILLLTIHLYAQVLGDSFSSLQFITKVLLLPSLILFMMVQQNWNAAPKAKWFIIIALFGSFMGDVLLTSEKYFIAGMLAFMTTHIFNILYFNKVNGIGQSKSKKWMIVFVILAIFCTFIFLQLKTAMGALIYPILVYMILICFSALMAIQAGGNSKATIISKLFWFPGMLFFITSDTVLAFNKFSWSLHNPIKNIGLVTMLTYGIAQLLLVKGFQLFLKIDSTNESNNDSIIESI